ncbi:hypothetical protein GJ496_011975 [Pomphorhynchus laevis]|nr:hypothetical protein GJ496_011975 [Pomphorhynchus laevis]
MAVVYHKYYHQFLFNDFRIDKIFCRQAMSSNEEDATVFAKIIDDAVTGQCESNGDQQLAILGSTLACYESMRSDVARLISKVQELNKKQEEQHNVIQLLEYKLSACQDVIESQRLQLEEFRTQSSTGTLIWKIDNIYQRLQDAESGAQTSCCSPILFSKQGQPAYRLAAQILLNGDGDGYGTHVSLFIRIERGIHDALLTWPFNKTIEFTLLNQGQGKHIVKKFRVDSSNLSKSFCRPVTDHNLPAGITKFCAKSVFFTDGKFIFRNNAFLQIKVI